MMKTRSFSVLTLLVVALMVALTGCGGGGNGSSSAPPTLNNPVTGNLDTPVTDPPEVTINVAAGGTVSFSHDDHTGKYGQKCDSCHGGTTPAFPVNAAPEKAPSRATGITLNRAAAGTTMAQIYAGQSCGKCHKNGGTAFNAAEGNRCKDCHFKVVAGAKSYDAHANITADSAPEQGVCKTCHSTLVSELNPKDAATGKTDDVTQHGRHGHDWVGSHGSAGSSCSECHHHEAVNPTAAVEKTAATQGTNNHSITCQTCHNSAATTSKRLRKEGISLCSTCHHARYVYGEAKDHLIGFDTVNDDPTAAGYNGYFMPPAYIAKETVNGDLTCIFNTAKDRSDVLLTTNLTNANATAIVTAFTKTVMGHYPHYSPQYDTLYGKLSKAWMIFSKDKDGKTLSYGDSYTMSSNTACADCHIVKNYASTTPSYGHTFVATSTSTGAKYGVSADTITTMEKEIVALEAEMIKVLDVDGDGHALWFGGVRLPNTDDQKDYRAALAEYTAGRLSAQDMIVLLGAAWNAAMLHGDKSEGMHNYQFVKDLCKNTTTVVKQVLAGKTGLPGTWKF